ncbi:hypothetical protein GIB67_022974 [Kingdonia uniflora]|uniref:Ferredoxin-thioredoxin reductase catalytic chain, chloroplastic n=1 Tax=Kingdonia uniflora TaxID=39325 RepID=A0A7J7P2F5_9MAGN|nr:hypothetical protein GIB67_022974 [Kingdonia uniflora]
MSTFQSIVEVATTTTTSLRRTTSYRRVSHLIVRAKVEPSEKSVEITRKFLLQYARRSGTYFSVDKGVTFVVIKGLVDHKDLLGAPLCPFGHYDDKATEANQGFWNCPCVPMRERLMFPLSNLAKGILNTIEAYPAQLNVNMWDVINVCNNLNRLWEENEVERRITHVDVFQYYVVKYYTATGSAYFFSCSFRPLFFYLNSAGRVWNDNMIWVKGDCLHRKGEEPMDLMLRTLNKSPRSQVPRRESLLDTVARDCPERARH